jgi:small nuclear ribonucleoprotein (snRNP)-like protein
MEDTKEKEEKMEEVSEEEEEEKRDITNPNDFLKAVIGSAVRVQLNSGIEYHGILTTLDGYMNLALENTEEVSYPFSLILSGIGCRWRGQEQLRRVFY